MGNATLEGVKVVGLFRVQSLGGGVASGFCRLSRSWSLGFQLLFKVWGLGFQLFFKGWGLGIQLLFKVWGFRRKLGN